MVQSLVARLPQGHRHISVMGCLALIVTISLATRAEPPSKGALSSHSTRGPGDKMKPFSGETHEIF